MIHPDLKPITQPYGKNRVILKQSFYYKCPKTQIETRTLVDFIFDGMSMPRLLWSILGTPFSPQNIGPALAHDNLYRYAKDVYGNKVTRSQADKVIVQALKMNDIGWFKRKTIWSGLRTGGWVCLE